MKTIKSLFLMVVTALSLALTQNVWAIEDNFALSNIPLLNNYLEGKLESNSSERLETVNRLKCQAAFADSKTGVITKSPTIFDSYQSLLDKAKPGSVAIIPISGALMKSDYCGWAGMETLSKWVSEADNHPNIAGILLLEETPGGSTDGLFEFVDVVKATLKPSLSLANGLTASAGYAIASGANERWAVHRSTRIGSIGTMYSIRSNTDATQHNIYADSSPDKNKAFTEAMKGNYTAIKLELLNPMNDIFLSYVRTNLGAQLQEGKPVGEGLPGEPLTGKVYLAETAKSFGLIDQIGTLQQAVERVKQLADSNYKIKVG